ncbi:MAG: 50S ribosome-binding GTPase [Methylococcales bacterium]|nr:50S ribosome-binding GTPase [Methylococcales bacterium]
MAYDYSDLVAKSKQWAEQAHTLGWIDSDSKNLLTTSATDLPDTLFTNAGAKVRPLIVAFMGGTGVGKSSLLNRLAGKAIAKAGIVRPTSREVTLFHHHSIALQQLPASLPLANITVAQHDDAAKQNIVWMDMPDFDSTEQSNKQLVLQWLPHIDVLIYVVSPERYRDEKAWRLLLAEGAKHAWLFVINQWDRGQTEQYQDFTKQLHKAGFVDPIIFKTACVENPQADQFDALDANITALATGHIVGQLEQRGMQVRKLELMKKLQTVAERLGPEQAFQQAPALWQKLWQRTVPLLQQGFAWPIQHTAKYYAEHAADLLSNPARANNPLWDAFAQARFDDALDELINQIDQLALPVIPIKQQLADIREQAPKIMHIQTELAARQALARPGNSLQRGFLKTMRLAEILLPLTAMAWVGYKVFIGYYTSNMTDNHYLGVDFAIHSSLIIAMTWLIPYFILKKAQPSLQKSALKGLNKGLSNAYTLIDAAVLDVLGQLGQQHQIQASQLSTLISQCAETGEDQNLSINKDSPLARMLIQ